MQPLDSKSLDSKFKQDVAARAGGENVMLCYACGTCTAGCPVAEIDPQFDPRRTIRQVLLGMRKEVLGSSEIWRCVQCHACTFKCPQNVRYREIVRALREMAVAEGFAEPERLARVDELGPLVQRLRCRMATALAQDASKYEDLRKQVEQLLQ